MRSTRSLAVAAVAAFALLAVVVSMTLASPPTDVTPTLIARGSYSDFKVASNPANGGMFKAEAKGPIDVVVRRHDYLAGGSTGWHQHPYPVFITVLSGQLTFYDANDPNCTPIVVSAGGGYVDSGEGHLVRNESGAAATDVSVIMAPVGGVFRSELPAPNPNCGF
jgi:quercetin dioxygenase-like cupin family protein